MMRFLSGASCSCLLSFFGAFWFLTSSCFFWQLRAFSHSSLPNLHISLVLLPLPTTTPQPRLAFVVLTTLHHHPFNTAHNPSSSLDYKSHLCLKKITVCSGLGHFGLVCCLWTPLYISSYVMFQLKCSLVPLFKTSENLPNITSAICWFWFYLHK